MLVEDMKTSILTEVVTHLRKEVATIAEAEARTLLLKVKIASRGFSHNQEKDQEINEIGLSTSRTEEA